MSAGDWKEMYRAAQEGNLEILKYHLNNGVDPNYQHPEILSTPLVTAIVMGHLKIARCLLEHGAKPDLLSEFDQMTPLRAAKKYRRLELVDLLQEILYQEGKLSGLCRGWYLVTKKFRR